MAGAAQSLLAWWHRLIAYIWRYMGTLSALALLLGVMGMGAYHVFTSDTGRASVRYFCGVCNTAAPAAPTGVGEIFGSAEGVTVPHIRFEYGADGRLARLVHHGEAGDVCPMPGSKVAEQRLVYNKSGRVVARLNYDERGLPVADSAGIAIREFEYDSAGRLTARMFRNAEGKKIVPVMPGFAEERIRYDEQGRPICIEYLDGEGRLLVNAAGESRVTFTYDEAARESMRTNHVNDKVAENADGVAMERVRHTADGLTSHTTWLDSAGTPVAHADFDSSSMLVEDKPGEKLHRTRYCGNDGLMRNSSRVWAEHLVRSNPQGSVEWECFNAADGLPCVNPRCGYAERLCEYTGAGQLVREFFWDARGNPADCYEKRHTSDGSTHHVISLHRDGSTELERTR